ncbi:hypothetical protein OZX74_07230 [Bifidobacterium sp. ESL0798]|uniref:hypothetical protein n=1 Tax=Bifidobacterium sp. ESL0798 TaxID=2983235 RepID=UPI0023F77C1A|nr:hypothetical protein [Bifidobacterium sp. ESL0798]WEV73688.1 hypothetical protein OZX74_07230 [Bifidobacterium sp. ESL0798]
MSVKYDDEGIVLRFEQSVHQTIGETSKFTGMVRAKYLIPVIDKLDLQANPRSSKEGRVTNAIQESIEDDVSLFPFKTKGILLAASDYEQLDRGRIRVFFDNANIEGILDGGHNTLAIGLLILERAVEFAGKKLPRGQKTWSEFKILWTEHRDDIQKYQEAVRKNEDGSSANPEVIGDLSFYVPVELLVPADPDNDICVDDFRHNLLEICEARNNNVELTASAKAHQKGYFADLAKLLKEENPTVNSHVEWKTNDGGDVKVADIIALTWIVLRKLPQFQDSDDCPPFKDAEGKVVEAPHPQQLYSGKGSCLSAFNRFMSSSDVTGGTNDYTSELHNPVVYSAFQLAVQIPELYDYIYAQFPDLYNRANGSYGNIIAVKGLNPTSATTKKYTPFSKQPVQTANPLGFIVPLVYGLTALVKVEPNKVVWRHEPKSFLKENLPKIVSQYKEVFDPCGYDPQKVGKSAMSYSTAENAYKMALFGIL